MNQFRRRLNQTVKFLRDAVRHGPRTARNIRFIFADRAKRNFYRGAIFRAAEFAVSFRMETGIIKLIGMDYAHRIVNAWRPREVHLLGELSLTFHEVDERRGHAVSRRSVEALAKALFNWFNYIGEDRTLASVREELCRRMGPETEIVEDGAADALNRTVDASTVPLLGRLHDIDQQVARQFSGEERRSLGDLGLYLYAHLKNENYWCTPTNSLAFATTGGDGVHYSLVMHPGGTVDEHSPVVMSVPANSGDPKVANLIIGDSLENFLRFGVRRGYFAMEQLVYAPEEALRAYCSDGSQPTDWSPPDEREREILAFLAERLELQPLEYTAAEFEELQNKFMPLLKFKPQEW